MIEDVYEPLSRFRDEFRGRFAALAAERIDSLVRSSGIDVKANARTSDEAASFEKTAASHGRWKAFFCALSVLSFLALAVAAGAAVLMYDELERGTFATLVAGAFAALALGILFATRCSRRARLQRQAEADAKAKVDEAWGQVAPLNALFGWDEATKLFESTVPRVHFDKYFAAERLDAMRRLFGLEDSFFDGKSVELVLSGAINGNPFLVVQYLEMSWGTKTYEGTKTISWTEYERDSNGRRRAVRRTETLRAHVTKPIPVYSEHKRLIYGNDAAPGLSFTHEPSGLSAKGGIMDSLSKRRRLSDLRKFSRNLDDDSNFTLMTNEEFETWFYTKDRDNEVEFRLLFTPVAQSQMLALMKDDKVGFGDDFTFVKSRKVNTIAAHHLDSCSVDTDPARFRHWDCRVVKRNFMDMTESFFRNVYFSLAPLLAIPLYQQTRTHEDIWGELAEGSPASSWEHESIANYFGDDRFKHPQCITRCILKTCSSRREDGTSAVRVTASGYKGEDRVDYVSVYGGDGRYHDVAVRWVQYLPVEGSGEMVVTEKPTPDESFAASFKASPASVFRRAMYSYLSACR